MNEPPRRLQYLMSFDDTKNKYMTLFRKRKHRRYRFTCITHMSLSPTFKCFVVELGRLTVIQVSGKDQSEGTGSFEAHEVRLDQLILRRFQDWTQ